MNERAEIHEESDYKEAIEEFLEIEVQEASEDLWPDATEQQIQEKVKETLGHNVDAHEWFTYNYPATWAMICYFHQGGIHEFSDVSDHIPDDPHNVRDVLKRLAWGCFYYDTLKLLNEGEWE